MKMKELPQSERPYEKLEMYGAHTLSNAELLAIIIKSGTRDESSISTAQKILSMKNKNSDNLRFIQDMSIEEFMSIKGIGKVKAIQLKAVCEIAKRISRPIENTKVQIKCPQDVANLLNDELKYEKRELVKVIILNTKNIVMKVTDICLGTENSAILKPRDALIDAVKMGAPKIILVHNHPSGDPTPSSEDINFTNRLIQASSVIGIELLDHVVIGDSKFESIFIISKIRKEKVIKMKFFGLGSKDIGIDLGTANILVTLKGKGIILNEPSVVALDIKTREILATGYEAKEMLGRTPERIKAVRPLKDGVIADFTATQLMLKNIIYKICQRYSIGKPRVVVGVPSGITEVEERAVEESILQAGAKEVYLIEEPMAAAIGANMDIAEPSGNIIVDIGGGTTEVAVISLGGVVVSNSIRIAGDDLDEDIVNYIKREKNLAIGNTTAEQAKKEIGCAMPLVTEMSMEIRGRDLTSGLPETTTITSNEMQSAMQESIDKIVEVVKQTLERTPPELASDIMEKGIVLAGGGALIKNLDKLLSIRTEMPVYIADDPLDCVVKGTGKTLDDLERLKTVLINSRKRR